MKQRICFLLLAWLVQMPAVRAITVSGRVAESDSAPVAGVTIRVEQVGGELPIFTTTTAADGTWSVSDALLFGNIRVTASSASFTFSPTNLDSFTSQNLGNQNFVATPTTPRPNITVLNGFQVVLLTGDTFTFPVISRDSSAAPAFIIQNDGTLPLTGIDVTIVGAPAGEFAVEQAPASALVPAGLTVMSVRFRPAALGVRSATMMIASDDPNENPFLVHFSATVLSIDVTNSADSGPGSLRQAIANTELTGGFDTIRLDPSLSGQTIILSNELAILAVGRVTIDASTLPGGLRLEGRGAARLIRMGRNEVRLTGLTLSGGNPSANEPSNEGGAIYSEGTLVIDRCTFLGNSAAFSGAAISSAGSFANLTVSNSTFAGNSGLLGGAISSDGTATIFQSTFSSNSANFGGAIYCQGLTVITRSTFSENIGNGGGAITYAGPTTLNHCTISANTANSAGGIFQFSPGSLLTLNFCIVAENFSASQNIFGPFANNGSITAGSVLLAPLGDYGGLTRTMALRPGSPARDGAAASTATGDQRGLPIVGAADIGAYEAGTFSNFDAFIWESLPAETTEPQHAGGIDFDGDGASNFDEWIALTNPADAASRLRIQQVRRSGDDLEVIFPTAAGRIYRLESTTDFANYVAISGAVTGDGTIKTVVTNLIAAPPAQFFRLRVATP